ncbi:MAG: pentapeptide repeat-containing protein [Microcoleus sp. PH2017_22_RUC_O_B]|uniref:globin domain-containing protein n=1 Tax=unclassified Microcoleus TaxID=2642155 RepID=UPI001D476D0F|nr:MULTISPECIES: globin domain-containing protein [unclassified Microcoleus]MCC3528435.1 pentapeptide repeat-containing protein [Microcoleus sp. PH2017_21_RUC_O_A]MCC3540611.1 pentapeptide repeat-containing protein [Microcoleus sp. PH2017_22_RUC_O_B]
MSLNVELLEQSFEKIKPHADEFAASFYEKLFTTHPELKPLFATTDMANQQKKLINALVLVVENIRSPEALEPVLNALGGRHIGYGVIPKYYSRVGDALLSAIEQYLQQDWTPEVKLAWTDAYRAITGWMLKGAGVVSTPEKVQLETESIPDKKVTIAANHKLETVPAKEQRLAVDVLESSFEKIKPRADELVASFYKNLFIAHAEFKPLFANFDLEKQQKKLINALVLVVENLRSPEALVPVLNALGGRQIGYGVIPKYYGPVGDALLMAFEQHLQEDWTPEVKLAWTDAYRAITGLILKGAGANSLPKIVPDQKDVTHNQQKESKTQLLDESKPIAPPTEPQKKPLVSIQLDGEIIPKMLSKITDSYQQFQSRSFLQRLGEVLKGILGKFIDNFWTQPAWLVATVSAVLFIIIYVGADDNYLIGEILEGADALSLVVALVLFIKEAPDRRKQFHYQAWSTVDAAQGVKVSYARILALQDLNSDGVSLRGLDSPDAELIAINFSRANLSAANLSKTDLSNANLSHANLDNANLSQAKLAGANLSHAKLGFARLSQVNLSNTNLSDANLICADLSNTNMSGVNLKNASFSGANLNSAYLNGANLKGAKVSISDLSGAFLEGAVMPDCSKYKSPEGGGKNK